MTRTTATARRASRATWAQVDEISRLRQQHDLSESDMWSRLTRAHRGGWPTSMPLDLRSACRQLTRSEASGLIRTLRGPDRHARDTALMVVGPVRLRPRARLGPERLPEAAGPAKRPATMSQGHRRMPP